MDEAPTTNPRMIQRNRRVSQIPTVTTQKRPKRVFPKRLILTPSDNKLHKKTNTMLQKR